MPSPAGHAAKKSKTFVPVRLCAFALCLCFSACNLGVPQVTPTVAPTMTTSITPSVQTTPSATRTDTPDPTLIAQLLATDTPTSTDTATATATATPTATATNTATDTPTPTASPSGTHTPIPTDTPSDTPTATNTPTVTDTPTDTPTWTSTPSDTPTPTNTPLPTDTHTPMPSPTPLPTIGPSDTPSPTATATPPPTLTPLPTLTDTPTATLRPSFTPAPTGTPTRTLSPEEIALLLGTPLATDTPDTPTEAPTLDVTPTIVTAAPETEAFNTPIVATTTPFVVPSETPVDVALPTLTLLPTLIPVDPQIRAFVLSTDGGFAGGDIGLLRDTVLFERNPVNPAQYAVTDTSGLLYFTGINGENAARVDVSPFSQFIPFTPEENNGYVSDMTWSPDGRYLAFLVDADESSEQASDGVWFFQPGQFPPIQLLVDCPKADHPGCDIVLTPYGPDLWQSLALEWSPNSNALLVQTWLPSENRLAQTIVPTSFNPAARDERPPVLRHDYASWEVNGNRVLVSGTAHDGNIYIAWVNPNDFNQIEVVFLARDNGLWVQNAVQRPDGSIVTLGAPFSEGGRDAPQRLYDAFGQPLTAPIGSAPPSRVEWSPDRSAVLVIAGGRQYVARINGEVSDITDQVRGARAINWVSGGLPFVDSPQSAPPPPDTSQGIAPIGVRETPTPQGAP